MADVVVSIDLSGVEEALRDLREFQDEVVERVGDLALMAHAHIKEQVQEKLNTRRAMYDRALRPVQQDAPGRWVISLDKSAAWIEEGMEAHSMLDDLLRTNAKTAADGSRYKVIPFDVGKGGATTTPGQALLNQALRAELKKKNIAYKAVERDPQGRPKTGLLHKFDVTDAPLRPAGTEGKPGWGKGLVGEVMRGPGPDGGSSGGSPLLAGVRIYQTALFKRDAQGNLAPELDKQGRQKATRGAVTFRVASSKHRGLKWEYPGTEGKHFFEEAQQWVEKTWDQDVLPDILRRFR